MADPAPQPPTVVPALGVAMGSPPSMVAMAEFVVPRSVPIYLGMGVTSLISPGNCIGRFPVILLVS